MNDSTSRKIATPGTIDSSGLLLEHREGLLEHVAPGWSGRLNADADEAERRFGEHGVAHTEGALDDHRGEAVGQDVAQDDAPMAEAEGFGGLNESPLADLKAPASTRRF